MWGIGVTTSFVVLLLLVSCYVVSLDSYVEFEFFIQLCCVITKLSIILWMLSIVYLGDYVGRMGILRGC